MLIDRSIGVYFCLPTITTLDHYQKSQEPFVNLKMPDSIAGSGMNAYFTAVYDARGVLLPSSGKCKFRVTQAISETLARSQYWLFQVLLIADEMS